MGCPTLFDDKGLYGLSVYAGAIYTDSFTIGKS